MDDGFWQDIGTPIDYLDLHRHLLGGEKKNCWKISEQAKIGSGVVLKGWGAIGPGAVIGDHARLNRCVVWQHAVIPSGMRLEDSIVYPGQESVRG